MSDETVLAQDTTEAGSEASTDVETVSTETGATDTTDTTTLEAGKGEGGEAGKADADGAKSEEGKEGENEESGDDPITYEFSLPDGREVDAEAVEAATPIFQELGLTQEQAQKLVEFYDGQQMKGFEAVAKAAQDKAEAQVKQIETMWGDNMQERMTDVARAADWADKLILDSLPEDKKTVEVETKDGKTRQKAKPFRDMLNETGAGNHPVMASMLSKFGELLAEDNIADAVRGGKEKTVAERWYSNS